jgi:histone acetyltransferase
MGWVILLNIKRSFNLIENFFEVKRYFLMDTSFKFFKQGFLLNEKKINRISFKFTRNDGTNASIKILTKLKILFSVQLPNIPRLYIEKQILDKKHILITLVEFIKKKKKIIGSCCFRVFESNQFIELIFFAISTKTQGLGYGTYLMSFLKDYAKSLKILYIVTCADNNAINFFIKQGFSRILSNPPSIWFRHIKEYEEVELMECAISSKNSYFSSYLTLLLQRTLFFEQFQCIINSKFRLPKQENKTKTIFNLATMISEKQEKRNFYPNLFKIIDILRSDKFLAPFFEPVDIKKLGINGYFERITNSVDIRSIEEKIRSKKGILKKKTFLQLIKRMINNSVLYNGNYHSIKEICRRLKKIFYSLHTKSVNSFL